MKSETLLYKDMEAEIFSLKAWIEIIDQNTIVDLFNELLSVSEFTVLKYDSYEFPQGGFTAYWLLAESHLAIHTFNSKGKSYVELSSCNKQKSKAFIHHIAEKGIKIKWEGENDILQQYTAI